MKILTLLAVVFTIAAVAFAVQNPIPVVVTFFGWQAQESLAVVLALVFGGGVLAGICVSFPSMVGRMRKISQLRHQVDEQTRELEAVNHQLTETRLKSAPISNIIEPPDRTNEPFKW